MPKRVAWRQSCARTSKQPCRGAEGTFPRDTEHLPETSNLQSSAMSSPVAQSVRDRLLRRSRETGEEHQVLLTRFALERFLYRLTQLPESEDFVLKGAFTFLVWEGKIGRQTRDLDLLATGSPEAERLRSLLREACKADVPEDGFDPDPESIEVTPIREGAKYEGLRAKLYAYIGSARLRLQIDIGFGDAMIPPPEQEVFPGLLDFPEPEIKTYRPETTVAEKLHGIVLYGRANTRMKDFYDLWRISRRGTLQAGQLAAAIQSTFDRRETALPEEPPIALTEAFVEEPGKDRQWRAFTTQLDGETKDLPNLLSDLRAFLLPVLRYARKERQSPGRWPPGGPWTSE